MASKYCNLVGTKKIKDEYKKINVGFDLVETDVNTLDTKIDNVDSRLDTKIDNVDSRLDTKIDNVDSRIDEIITTPAEGVSAQEIIDARGGRLVLRKRFEDIEDELAEYKAENTNFLKQILRPGIVTFPDEFNSLPKFRVRKNINGKLSYDFEPEELFPEVGGKTYYVNPFSGSNSNDGLSAETPLRTIAYALTKSDVETIYLFPGLYDRDVGLSGSSISKNIKLKALNGKVYLSTHISLDWEEYENIYIAHTTLNINYVYARSDYDFYRLQKVNTIEEVLTIKDTWFVDSNNVLYVNTNNIDNIIVSIISELLNIKNAIVYTEGIEFLFGTYCARIRNGTLLAKNCSFKQARYRGLYATGSNVYMTGCESSYHPEQGFQYQKENGVPSKFIEVDCLSHSNGFATTSQYMAGSRSNESVGIRVGGFYFKNKGANVDDKESYTYNLGVTTYANTAIKAYQAGFANQAGWQWLDNCYSYDEGIVSRNTGEANTKIIRSIMEGEILGDVEFIGPSLTNGNEQKVSIQIYRPTSRLSLEYEDSEGYYPRKLSKDGNTIWGNRYNQLVYSTDGWGTKETLHTFDESIVRVEELDNGELIVGTKSEGIAGSLYLSSDNKTTWTKVLEASSNKNTFTQAWGGVSIYQNIVVAGEYGSKTPPNNARKVFLSTDYGKTFNEILDLGIIEGKHLHGVAYDPWYKRIWVVNGDGEHKGIRFSDDWGQSWHVVSNNYQAVGIIPLENSVLFTMDGAPNGVMLWKRTRKEDRNLKLEIGFNLNPESNQTLYCGQSHYIGRDGVVYMPILHVGGGHYYILATKDGITIHELYRSVEPVDSWKGIINIMEKPTGGMIGLYNVIQNSGFYGIVKSASIPQWVEI